MTSKKQARRALVASFTSLLLCCAMLVGTTFAWFTDSVTVTNNTITAGNLDVEVYYAPVADENGVVYTEITDDMWQPVKADSKLFKEDTLWEPGHAQAVYLKIVNEGTLAFKYTLDVLAVSEKTGTSVLGNEIKLSDILMVDMHQNAGSQLLYTGRTEGNDAVTIDEFYQGFASIIPGFEPLHKPLSALKTDEGMMKAGETMYVQLGVYMPTTVGNEANYRGADIPQINLGINVLAAQVPYEKDSFGDDYDEEALYPVVDLKGFIGAIEEGKDVKLEADITLPEAVEISGDVTVDLNGFDLDASAASSAFTVAAGESASLTVNGSDETVELGAKGLIDVAAGADAVIEINGGNFVSDDAGSTLIKPNGDGEIKIVLNDVNYKSTAANGYALDCSYYAGENLSVEINGGSFEATTGLLLPEGSSVNGAEITVNNTKNMQPAVYAMGDMTIENCIIKADKSHAVAVAGGATLTVNNCEVYAGSNAGSLAFQVFSSGGTININSCTWTGGYGSTGKMTAGRPAIINIDGVEMYRKNPA